MQRIPKKLDPEMERAMRDAGIEPGKPMLTDEERSRHAVSAKGVPLTPQARMVKREMRRHKREMDR